MPLDPNARQVASLESVGLDIYIVSLVTGALALIVVSLRTYIRKWENVFGWDDGLMLAGLVMYLAEIAIACKGAQSGLGQVDSKLNSFLEVDAMKYMIIWILLYVSSLVLIKSAICTTLFRISSAKTRYRICIWALWAVSIATFVTTFVGILLLCQPVEAIWDTALVIEGKAQCAGLNVMIALLYTSTAATIATDMACAVLPGVILWHTQMDRQTKFSVALLLSFGSIASISTIIRTPYIRYCLYPNDDLPYHIGSIVLWSNVESAIGLIAGSLPALRRFWFHKMRRSKSEQNPRYTQGPIDLFMLGDATPSQRPSRKATATGPPLNSFRIATARTNVDGIWTHLGDESSDKEILEDIRPEYASEIELTRRPERESMVSVHH